MRYSGILSITLVLMVGATALADPPAAAPMVPKQLLEKRLEVTRAVYMQKLKRIRLGQASPSQLFGWSERWLDAELALATKRADRVKALRNHLDRVRKVEEVMTAFARAGQGRQADTDAATYYRLQAEIRLYKEGVQPQPAKGKKGKGNK